MTQYHRQIIPHFGDAHVFETEQFSMPVLTGKQLAIEVQYIGVNYADILARRGYYKWAGKPPLCPGFELSGTVVDRGPDATVAVGTRVMAFCRFNAYTELFVADQDRVLPLSDSITLQEAAALPAVFATAYHALFEVLRVRSGDSILIQAVAGGVGLAALQLAKHAGLVVYGTASSAQKLAFAQGYGLDHPINYVERDFEGEVMRLSDGKGVRFVLDSLGGEGFRKGYRCLSSPGHALVIGAADVVPPQGLDLKGWYHTAKSFIAGGVFHPFPLVEKNRGVSGMQILLLWDQLAYLQGLGRKLLSLHAEGVIKPFVHEIFPLEKAGDAHTFMDQRKSRGKLLLSTRFAA